MKTYDAVIIGAGDVGAGLAFKAAAAGLKVALVDKGTIGGTCLNNGCVPSKTLIHAADRVVEIRDAARLGIRATIAGLDFAEVMNRTREIVAAGRDQLREALESTENIALHHRECRFVSPRVLDLGTEKITGRKIFVATGSRPVIPPIPGLEGLPYLTNENLLALERMPESVIMIGGGYVGLEYAHFFAAFGARVSVLERGERLLPQEEAEVSALLEKKLGARVDLLLGAEVVEVRRDGTECVAVVRERGGRRVETRAEQLFVAAGRRSNADLLQVGNAGIALDDRGFIRVDDELRTSTGSVWALGDATGKAMFTHAGDKAVEVAWHNASRRRKVRMDFASVPHAVFTSPQIASVGLTEELARKDHEVLVGRARYADTVLGRAMAEDDGFAKAVVDKGTRRILGFHVVGPQASTLIAEVVNAVIRKESVEAITGCMHIFPALSDLVTEAFANLE